MKRIAVSLTVFLVFTSCLIGNVSLISAKSGDKNTTAPSADRMAPVAFREEFLDRINQLREKGITCNGEYMPPVPPVEWNDQLELAAYEHARDMNHNRYFDHISKDGRTLKDRIFATGYTYDGYRSFFIGENIALGQVSIREVMRDWMKSYGHCKNLMNPDFKEVGIAVVNSYWVQDFGARNPFDRKWSRRK